MIVERKRQIKLIGEQFNEKINNLAVETDKEIQLMVNDSASAFETRCGRKPSFSDQSGFYDNLLFRFVHSLLVIRDAKISDIIKKIDENKGE